MDRVHYLTEVEAYLQALTDEERKDVLDYYSEYIDDAGLKTREEIEAKLGSPRQLSYKILADYSIKENDTQKASPRSNFKLVLIIILAATSMLTLGGGIILLALLIALAAVVFALAMAALAIVVAAIVAGFASLYAGFGLLLSAPATAVFYLGLGLVFLAAVMVGVPLLYWAGKVVCKGLANFSKYVYHQIKTWKQRRSEK